MGMVNIKYTHHPHTRAYSTRGMKSNTTTPQTAIRKAINRARLRLSQAIQRKDGPKAEAENRHLNGLLAAMKVIEEARTPRQNAPQGDKTGQAVPDQPEHQKNASNGD